MGFFFFFILYLWLNKKQNFALNEYHVMSYAVFREDIQSI